jgi:hypothetical protein
MSSSTITRLTIGIDFGGVLSTHDRNNDVKTDVVGEHKNTAVNMPDSLNVLEKLKESHSLILISFCGQKRAVETKASLDTSVPGLFDSIFFTKDKMYKKDICSFAGCDVMIDDTLGILTDIRKVNKNITLIWFTAEQDVSQNDVNVCKNNNILISDSWLKIPALLPSKSLSKPNHELDLSKKLYKV